MQSELLDFAINKAKMAGEILLENYNKEFSIAYKGAGPHNLVTEIDLKSEKFIVDAIKTKYPDHCILAEEDGECGTKSPYRWIIDPLDGTTNYAHGYNFFAVCIGLEVDGEIVLGVVHAPYFKETFYAEKDKGAFLNDKPIHTSTETEVSKSLLATGFSYKEKTHNIPYFQELLLKSRAIRRCGSAALDICYVAAGRLDGFWEFGLGPWDIAAGKIIVEEAGGRMTSLNGSPVVLDDQKVLATNGGIHEEMTGFFQDT